LAALKLRRHDLLSGLAEDRGRAWEDDMPLAGYVHAKPIEYFMLHDAKPTGPSMGRFADREIPESVVDVFGRRYVYVGVAPRRWDGQFDVDALGTGEFILPPGLVYRRKGGARPSWFGSLLGTH
jgi:hypothetical protein